MIARKPIGNVLPFGCRVLPWGTAEDKHGLRAEATSRERMLRAEQGEAAIELLERLGVTPAMQERLTEVWTEGGDLVAELTRLQEQNPQTGSANATPTS